jgi:hypothetical protein
MKSSAVRVTAQQVVVVKQDAKKHFGLLLTDEQAHSLIRNSEEVREDLSKYGLGTYGRDYLIMEIIEQVLPGQPTVQDSLVWMGRPLQRWHWPCNGSGDEYRAAFYEAFKTAAKEKGYKLRKGWDSLVE